jgi:Protein of unknown function (DUF4230)
VQPADCELCSKALREAGQLVIAGFDLPQPARRYDGDLRSIVLKVLNQRGEILPLEGRSHVSRVAQAKMKAMEARNWKTISLILIAAFVSLLGYVLVMRRTGPDVPQDSVVLQVQKLSQLVTIRYRIQRVVAMTEQKQPLGEESILLMVEGEVQAGVNLQRVSNADLSTSDIGVLTIRLPAPAILNASLDESKTKIWDRHITWWTPWVAPDPSLEHNARMKALGEIREAALEMGILNQAKSNTETALKDLFSALGWKINVEVKGQD